MPIRDCMRALYPADWRDIATAVKQRAAWKCEGSPAYPDCRAAHGAPHPVTGDGRVLFNFLPHRSKGIDKQREGWLLYKQPEEGE